MLGRRKMLGLAVTQRSITAVEVVAADGGARATRAAEFIFPRELDPDDPARLGDALRQFLRAERFSSRHCVIGMEATWLTAREKSLPPGAGDSLKDILTIAVEREFASDRKDLLFDYTAAEETEEGQSALLVAAPLRQVDLLRNTAQAAGLTVLAVTSSTMALAGYGDRHATGEQLVLHLFPGGAELARRVGGTLDMVRRLPIPVPAGRPGEGLVNSLADELRRVLALLPGERSEKTKSELLIWNSIRLDSGALDVLSGRLEMGVGLRDCPDGLDCGEYGPDTREGQFQAAAAMAMACLHEHRLPVDFTNSRLAPPRKSTLTRKIAWAAATSVSVLLALTFLLLEWRADSNEVADMETRLEEMAPDLERAQKTIDRTAFARSWYDKRPGFMDCLYELTLLFPREGGIWTTSLGLEEDMKVVFSGKADSESRVLALLDGMKAHPSFTEVKPLYLRRSDRGDREVSFAMSFRFEP